MPMRCLRSAVVIVLIAPASVQSAAIGAATDAYADQLGKLVNDYRKREGLPPLEVDERLTALAREHSEAMAKAGSLNHQGMESRVKRSGYAMCVENVGWNYATPSAQMEGWQHSAGHDRNMREKRVQRMGIGFASEYVTFIACQ